MAHRVLTPSSPYVATPTAASKPAHDANHRQIGKENLIGKNSASVPVYRHQPGPYCPTPQVIAPSSSSAASSVSTSSRPPDSPLLSSAYISSPQLSTFVAAAPAPSYAAVKHSSSLPLPAPAVLGATSHVVNHYHRPTASAAAEPSMAQLLAEQPKGMNHYASRAAPERDSTMANATGVASWRKGQGFKEWEKVKLNSAEVKRKADVAQLCQWP